MSEILELYDDAIKFLKANDPESAYQCIEALYVKARGSGSREDGYKVVKGFRKTLKGLIERGEGTEANYDLLEKAYDLTGADYLDDFMIAVEWRREPEARFWLPRREQLLPICAELQGLADGQVDELFLSQPPRTGKTTLVMFFIVWYMCRNPEISNLYSSFTEKVVAAFYEGMLEIFNDPVTYALDRVFPHITVARTNAKDLLFDLNRRKRYASLTCRSIDGTLNGACDAEGVIIADDLHSGVDEARSKDQMLKKWDTVRANLLSRKKGNAKILWIGTHWSLIDSISNRLEMLENDPACAFIRYRVFNVPALNENEESNFDYMYHKGFTTDDYKAIRASYEAKDDLALWLAPYMGAPIERSGAVFAPDELRYYNGELPMDGDHAVIEPDRKFMVVDPAWGGGDYVAAVVVFQYGDDLYVPDVVYNNGDKGITQPEIVRRVEKWDVQALYIEATRVTQAYAEDIDKRLRDNGIRLNINGNVKNWNGQQGKQQRIYDKAPEIRERFIFLDRVHWTKDYTAFMQNVFSFVVEGKNKHDDAPDVLAMTLANATKREAKIQVLSRALLDMY